MTDQHIIDSVGKNVIVSDRWGFGLKFYQAKLIGVELHHYRRGKQIHLNLGWYEKYAPITQRTYDLRPGDRMIYLPT